MRHAPFSFSLWMFAAAVLVLAATGRPASAGFIVYLQESGGNVIATGSGTLNTSALSFAFSGTDDSFVYPSAGDLIIGAHPSPHITAFSGIRATFSFGNGGYIQPTSGSGDQVGLDIGFAPNSTPPDLYVPFGYVSGSALSDTATWKNQTFTSLGITPGTYKWTWGTGTAADFFEVTTNAPPVAVPAPGSLTLLLVGSGMLGAARLARRRREAASWPSGSPQAQS